MGCQGLASCMYVPAETGKKDGCMANGWFSVFSTYTHQAMLQPIAWNQCGRNESRGGCDGCGMGLRWHGGRRERIINI